MPRCPRTGEPCAKVRGGWCLSMGNGERVRVDGGLDGCKTWVSWSGKQFYAHALVSGEVGQVPNSQDLSNAEDQFQLGGLEPSALHALDP
ncbi:hypothetical protein SSPS47_11400 [Streptomyces sp. S4.7]|nr:hypothetical protein SSPS47_11400 [Streptomyces sp. S4.7]